MVYYKYIDRTTHQKDTHMGPNRYPAIMVVKEKHRDTYFYLTDPEDLHKVAVMLLKERKEDGYWYPSAESIEQQKTRSLERLAEGAKAEYLELSEEQVETLPEAIKQEAVKYRTKHAQQVARINEEARSEMVFVNRLDEVLSADEPHKVTFTSKRNGNEYNLAFSLLQHRADGEYEGYDFEIPEKIVPED